LGESRAAHRAGDRRDDLLAVGAGDIVPGERRAVPAQEHRREDRVLGVVGAAATRFDLGQPAPAALDLGGLQVLRGAPEGVAGRQAEQAPSGAITDVAHRAYRSSTSLPSLVSLSAAWSRVISPAKYCWKTGVATLLFHSSKPLTFRYGATTRCWAEAVATSQPFSSVVIDGSFAAVRLVGSSPSPLASLAWLAPLRKKEMNFTASSGCSLSAATDSVWEIAPCAEVSPRSGGRVIHSKSSGACSTTCWRR